MEHHIKNDPDRGHGRWHELPFFLVSWELPAICGIPHPLNCLRACFSSPETLTLFIVFSLLTVAGLPVNLLCETVLGSRRGYIWSWSLEMFIWWRQRIVVLNFLHTCNANALYVTKFPIFTNCFWTTRKNRKFENIKFRVLSLRVVHCLAQAYLKTGKSSTLCLHFGPIFDSYVKKIDPYFNRATSTAHQQENSSFHWYRAGYNQALMGWVINGCGNEVILYQPITIIGSYLINVHMELSRPHTIAPTPSFQSQTERNTPEEMEQNTPEETEVLVREFCPTWNHLGVSWETRVALKELIYT